MVGCLGVAPSSHRLRAGTSLSKFATLMAVCKDRDTKAELNHRGEVCEALAGTGISRRVKWSERRVTLPLDLAPEASASLLGYALEPWTLPKRMSDLERRMKVRAGAFTPARID